MSELSLQKNQNALDPFEFDARRVERKAQLKILALKRGESFERVEDCLAIVDGLVLGRGKGIERLAESRQRLGW